MSEINIRDWVEKTVMLHRLAAEKLSQEQLIEAITQAVMSGDFVKFVTQDGSRQQVAYIPGQVATQLQIKLSAATQALTELHARKREDGAWERFVCPVHLHHDCQCGEAFAWLPILVK